MDLGCKLRQRDSWRRQGKKRQRREKWRVQKGLVMTVRVRSEATSYKIFL